jgi:hypothetical protein
MKDGPETGEDDPREHGEEHHNEKYDITKVNHGTLVGAATGGSTPIFFRFFIIQNPTLPGKDKCSGGTYLGFFPPFTPGGGGASEHISMNIVTGNRESPGEVHFVVGQRSSTIKINDGQGTKVPVQLNHNLQEGRAHVNSERYYDKGSNHRHP